MASQRDVIYFNEGDGKPCRVVKFKVCHGSNLTLGQVVMQYEFEQPEISCEGDSKISINHPDHINKHLVVRAMSAGTVENVFVKEGDIVTKGSEILEYSSCTHPTVMKDMCAECGADLKKIAQRNQTAAVAMVHNIPELMVSMEEAQSLGKADEERLLRDRKLVLLVDLDQTLIHTTNDMIPPNIKDVFHFQLHGHNSVWYHTRLRPHTREFLKDMSTMYELHICTFGSRTYAHKIAEFLDEEGRYFSHRILSRDECFSFHSKKANLKALFPCGDHMVVIIDDREDVWNFAPNLIHVRPYHFFQHTGDINAPPGLSKKEFDDKEGFDFSALNADKTKENEPVKKEESKQTDTEESNGKNNEEVSEIPEATDKEEKTEEASEIPEATVKEEKTEADKSPEQCNGKSTVDKNDESEEKKVVADSAPTEVKKEVKKEVEVTDADDYLLHLHDILGTIHRAYYEIYDEMVQKEGKNSKKEVPDMKRILPYVRRKVLQDVSLVFSGVVPTNVQQEKSRPYLVARSLGASIMDAVTESTTHVIAARLGTAKLNDAKKYKHIQVVTPDWLWCCAERWEHVNERLFPLNTDTAAVRRKPPAHCTSPDVALQLAMAAGAKEETEGESDPLASTCVYDRVTGKRIFRKTQSKNDEKGKAWASSRSSKQSSERPQRRFSETFNPLLAFSSEDIADMESEVEDILHEEQREEPDYDGGVNEAELQEEQPHHKRRCMQKKGSLIIGDVSETNDPENESLLTLAREGWPIPQEEVEEEEENELNMKDRDDDEEEPNVPELDDLEQDEDVLDDSEWCLAGQALEREFLSGGEED